MKAGETEAPGKLGKRVRPPGGSARFLRRALHGVGAGFLLIPADRYFGTGDGVVMVGLAAFLLAASLAIAFIAISRPLVHPRRLDIAFLAGGDYRGRKREALLRLRAAGTDQAALPLGAAVVVCLAGGQGLLFTAAVLGLLVLEALVLCALLAAVVRFGWLPVSRERFSEGAPRKPLELAPPSLLLRGSFRVAGLLAWPSAGPRHWLLRRTWLHVLRRDPVFLALYLGFLSALGVLFHVHWSLAAAGAFALIGCMLTLTLVQLATDQDHEQYRLGAYLMPPPGEKFRSDLRLFLAVAGAFLLYFTGSSLFHLGPRQALAAPGFWQVLATGLAFPFLTVPDPRSDRPSTDALAVLNFSYLGLAGGLFFFPGYGLAVAVTVCILAAIRCHRLRASRWTGLTVFPARPQASPFSAAPVKGPAAP